MNSYVYGSNVSSSAVHSEEAKPTERNQGYTAGAKGTTALNAPSVLLRQRGRFDGNPKVISTLDSLSPLGSINRFNSSTVLDTRRK